MSKRTRLHFKNAKYHVMLRGNYRQNIFQDDIDFQKMYTLMEAVTKKYHCHILLFSLMTNHTHMVIQVTDIPLAKIMQSLVSRYARYYNTRLKRTGHLFQDRYHAKIIMNDNYLLELCYYVHNNPRAAGIVTDLNDYRWSSHRHYNHLEVIPWLSSDDIVEFLQNRFQSQEKYYEYLFADHGKSNSVDCEFDEDNILTINNVKNITNISNESLNISGLSINEIAEFICQHMNVPKHALSEINLSREVVTARAMIAYFAHYHGKHQLKLIASEFDQKADSVSINLHKMLENKEYVKLRCQLYESFRAL